MNDAVMEAPFRFDPYAPGFDANPFPVYDELREHYPCYWSEEAGMWVLTRYDDVLNALRDWKTYSSASGNLIDELPGRAGATLGTTDPPRHDGLRGLIQHAVMKSALNRFVDQTRDFCRTHLERLNERNEFDLVAEYTGKVTVDFLFHLFDIPAEHQDQVRDAAILMVQTDSATRQEGPEHLAAYEWMAGFAERLIEERRANSGDDLLSNFISAEIDGEKLLDREIKLTITTLLMAGVESLSGYMGMFALNLADYPDVRKRLAADPSLIPAAIEESLRFNTSAQRFKRRLQRDVELHGQQMKAGDYIMLCYGGANRDPRKFDNPHVYDIDRNTKGHLGFGGGVHSCLGAMIARMVTQVALEELLAAIPDYSRLDQELNWVPSSNFRSPRQLRIRRG